MLPLILLMTMVPLTQAVSPDIQVYCGEIADLEDFELNWPATVVDGIAIKPCPDTNSGALRRRCEPDASSVTGGRWGPIVWDECELVMGVLVGAVLSVCPSGRDDAPGSLLLWPETPAGVTYVTPCPPGQLAGNVSRTCEDNPRSPTGGQWAEVDVTECTNPVMQSFYEAAIYQVNQRPARADDMIALMNDLQQIVSQASSNDTLYPSDLVLGTDIMHQISQIVGGLRSIHRRIDVLAQTYGDSISALTSNETLPVWENQHKSSTLMATATTILQSMDNLAVGLLNTKFSTVIGEKVEWTTLRINSSALDFEVVSYPEEFSGVAELKLSGSDDRTQIIFPKEVVNTTHRHATAGIYGFYRGQYLTITSIFNKELSRNPNTSHYQQLSTPIISARPLAVDHQLFQNLSEPIILIFRHLAEDKYTHGMPKGRCHFLNMTAEDDAMRWSTQGCELAESNDTVTICHCYHLTNFALLMDLFNVTLSNEHVIALTFISYVGGTLSVLGCVLSIIIYEYFGLSGDCIRIHEMLATSIVLSQITFFVGFEMVHIQPACQALAVLLHTFLISMFCWMLVEGIHLYICLVKVFRRRSNFKKYCVIGWGAPVVIVGVSVMVFLDDYGGPTMCWVTTRVLWIAFVPFVVLTIMINLGVLILVLRVMHQSISRASKNKSEELPVAKAGLKAIVILMPLLGLTWSFGFLSINAPGSIVFTYLFTICNSLQGVFFFTFHCLLNNEVKRAFDRRYQGRRHQSSRGGTKSTPEPGVSPLTGTRAAQDLAKYYSQDSPKIKYLGLSKKTSASSKSSVETTLSHLDHFDDIIINDEDFMNQLDIANEENRDAKDRKNLNNMKHKLAEGRIGNTGQKKSDRILGESKENSHSKALDLKEALAAMDSAILVHTDHADYCCVTHM